MKPNLLYSLKSNARAVEKCIAPKSELTMLLLLFVALASAGCETLESGSSGAVAAPSSSWPTSTGSPAYAGGHGFAASLSGRWFHGGQPTSINVEADGRNLMIINENGQRSSGYANSPYELEIPSLRIKGRVGDGGRRISWSNGTTWTRQPHEHGSDSGQGLSGRWYHDGKPTNISVSSGGQSVTITNEVGQSSSGSITGNDITIGGLRGHVSHNGRRISWSNGTEWTR
jgi:hypothetical protein